MKFSWKNFHEFWNFNFSENLKNKNYTKRTKDPLKKDQAQKIPKDLEISIIR